MLTRGLAPVVIDASATRVLEDHGYAVGDVLGAGMEGAVVALADGLVAKVWRRRTGAEAARLAAFYDALARVDVGLRLPRIRRVLAADGRAITVEDRLDGRPLPLAESSAPHLDDGTVDCVIEVLAALAAVDSGDAALASLPVIEGEEPFDPEHAFEASLAGLVERRVARFEEPLARHLPDLDRIAAAVAATLRGLTPATPGLLHGDLIPANLRVADDGRPTVLDFGFLTTVGDPAFDAAVTASIYEMYGAGARGTERLLDRAFAASFGYDPHRIVAYRAAYALVTANCFSPEGDDGHFAWCVALLRRDDVREGLGL